MAPPRPTPQPSSRRPGCVVGRGRSPLGARGGAMTRSGVGVLPRLLTLAALALLGARCAWTIIQALDVFADYHAYYRAADNLRAGRDLYAEGRLLVARNSYDFWTQTDGQYVYPPLLALLLLPLTVLDIGKGGVVWLLALVLTLLGTIWLAARLCGRAASLPTFLAVALPVAGTLPLALGVRYGLIARGPLLLAGLALGGHLVFVLAARRSATPPRPAVAAVALALLAIGVAALLLGLREGRIDPFLLALACPGLAGTVALTQARTMPAPPGRVPGLRATLVARLGALLPVALPLLGGTPLLLGLQYGQSDLFLLLLTALAFLAHLRRREALAGIALGVAAALKPTVALYGLYYLRKRCWTTLATAALTGTALGLAPFALLGGDAFADWLTISRYFGGGDYAAYPTNQSLHGLLLRAFVGGPHYAPLLANRALADGGWLVLAGGVLLLWWRILTPRREDAARAALEYGLTIAAILIAAPLSEDIHFVGLLLPFAFLADRIARGEGSTAWRAWALLCCLPFVLPPPALPAALAGDAARLLVSAPYLGGAVLLGGVLIARLRATRRELTPLAYSVM